MLSFLYKSVTVTDLTLRIKAALLRLASGAGGTQNWLNPTVHGYQAGRRKPTKSVAWVIA